MSLVHRILTIREPWASLAAYGIKKYETRSVPTKYRGLVFIHAGLYVDAACREKAEQHRQALFDHGLDLTSKPDWESRLPRGAVIGAALITASMSCEELSEQGKLSAIESTLGDYGPERYAWQLESPVYFQRPVMGWSGVLGLREMRGDLLERCVEQIHRSANTLQQGSLLAGACATEAA